MKIYERTEDGTTTRVTVQEALTEVNAAMMQDKHNVRRMSSGRTRHDIEYKDGRHVVLTLADQPEVTEPKTAGHCVTMRGTGAVHTDRPIDGESWAECRTGGQDSRGTAYTPTTAALTCRNCIEQERRRALAAR